MADRPGEGRNNRPDAKRVYVYLQGFGDRHKLICHNNSKVNIGRALVERVFRVKGPGGDLQLPPRPAKGVFASKMAEAFEVVTKILPPSFVPLTMTQFVGQVPAAKRLVYERAHLNYLNRGLYHAQCGVSAFVKFEKIILTDDKPDPVPRVIQTRSPVYHLRVGRFTRAIEKHVYDCISVLWGGPTVMKGINPDQVASNIVQAWNEFSDPVGVPLDAKRFDQHVSACALGWEHRVYNHCFGGDPELAWLLRQQLRNTGYADYPGGQIKYETDGCRMSGDMNTGLGNCLLMSCMMWAYCREVKVKARLINQGDDCVLIISKKDLPKIMGSFHSWFLELGFNMAIEGDVVAERLEEIVFCQLQLVNTGKCGWTMVRQPKAVVKDAACLTPDFGGIAAWMHAVGECGGALAGDIPVYGAIYRAYARSGVKSHSGLGVRDGHHGFRNTGMALASRGMNRAANGSPSATARASFYFAFGICPDLQIALESRYDNLERGFDPVGFSLHDLLPRE